MSVDIKSLSNEQINELQVGHIHYKGKTRYYIYKQPFYLLTDTRVVHEETASWLVSDTDLYYFDTKDEALQAIEDLKMTHKNLVNNVYQQEAYLALHKSCPIEVGDTVEFVRDWRYGELGCVVGPFGEADIILGSKGIVVEKSAVSYRVDGNLKNCIFPCFALRLVEKKMEPIKVKLNDSYTAEVFKDKVTVGCQTFSFDCINKLYQAALKIHGKI